MDSVSSVSIFSDKVQTTQPFLSKRGMTLQGNAVNPSLGAEKVATQETAPTSQTPQKHFVDIQV